ncbi:type II toxin-antitoxin system YhaV family toxin [Salinicola sp. JS01]|uniref:type II toxin-antitoxin system YhaV family toxin n=1 Tax=Salinicola sp. JS01 TaxID=3050071 RepID=UPI00255BAD99|nr:type II toxin-antitoxin system YhaV family toxin [Salinicola sp. JS01]WIX33026.1 type II toxin-antitoxin system YhaV family toxin [Salinicola sp. JS01]
MTMTSEPLVINGWTLLAHPLFLDQVATLTARVERLAAKDPTGYRSRPATKRLAAIIKLTTHDIPQDPAGDHYRQGKTLGSEYTHWRRAKFYQQYRLFFRYDLASRIIVYAWVNDETAKRAFDSKSDAYVTFSRMLDSGNPPDSWQTLQQAALAQADRATLLLNKPDDPD